MDDVVCSLPVFGTFDCGLKGEDRNMLIYQSDVLDAMSFRNLITQRNDNLLETNAGSMHMYSIQE